MAYTSYVVGAEMKINHILTFAFIDLSTFSFEEFLVSVPDGVYFKDGILKVFLLFSLMYAVYNAYYTKKIFCRNFSYTLYVRPRIRGGDVVVISSPSLAALLLLLFSLFKVLVVHRTMFFERVYATHEGNSLTIRVHGNGAC